MAEELTVEKIRRYMGLDYSAFHGIKDFDEASEAATLCLCVDFLLTELANKEREMAWHNISTAPLDGTEVLGYREDCGEFIMRYTAPIDFCTDSELENLDEHSAEAYDWFFADFVSGGRLDGTEAPTHWLPIPHFGLDK